ncbi:MAG: hypothetical protein LBJ67_09375 [Planctomycetaceae bacterium]|jgi:hypothetical protein|nr:hypothetical protein [Planctomycetaceae bacterium]
MTPSQREQLVQQLATSKPVQSTDNIFSLDFKKSSVNKRFKSLLDTMEKEVKDNTKTPTRRVFLQAIFGISWSTIGSLPVILAQNSDECGIPNMSIPCFTNVCSDDHTCPTADY